jgi:hypothetical protein
MTCKLNTRKAQQVVLSQGKAPIPRQLLSMTPHLGYPIVTQGHRLTCLTPIARPNRAHRSHRCSQNQKELTGLTPVAQNYPNPTLDEPNPTNRVKGPCRS